MEAEPFGGTRLGREILPFVRMTIRLPCPNHAALRCTDADVGDELERRMGSATWDEARTSNNRPGRAGTVVV